MAKVGIRNGSLRMGMEEALRVAGEIGYDGVEWCVSAADGEFLASPNGVAEAREWAEASRCQICSLSVGTYRGHELSTGDPAERAQRVAFVEKWLGLAKEVGGVAILLPQFERDREDKSLLPDEEANYIEGLKACAPAAERLQIYIGLETSFNSRQLERIMDAVDSPWVGAYQDVSNALYYGHETVEMLERLKQHNAVIHIKDTGQNNLGEGQVDWDGVRRVLPTLDYGPHGKVGCGWFILETPAGDDAVANARFNLAFTRDLVKSLD